MFDVLKKHREEKVDLNPTQETVENAVSGGGKTVEKNNEDVKFEKAKEELTKKFGQRINQFGKAGNKVDVKKLVNDYMEDSNGEILINESSHEVIWKVKKLSDKVKTGSSSSVA